MEQNRNRREEIFEMACSVHSTLRRRGEKAWELGLVVGEGDHARRAVGRMCVNGDEIRTLLVLHDEADMVLSEAHE